MLTTVLRLLHRHRDPSRARADSIPTPIFAPDLEKMYKGYDTVDRGRASLDPALLEPPESPRLESPPPGRYVPYERPRVRLELRLQSPPRAYAGSGCREVREARDRELWFG